MTKLNTKTASLALMLAASAANATLIVEDPFMTGAGHYPVNVDISGKSSSAATGFSGTWGSGTTSQKRAQTENLTYTGGGASHLATSGGSLQYNATFNNQFRHVHNGLSPFAAAGTYYFSALIEQPDDPSDNGEAFIGFTNTSGTAGLRLGYDDEQIAVRTNEAFTSGITGEPTTATDVQVELNNYVPMGQANLLIARIDVNDSGNDTLQVWFNPLNLDSEGLAGLPHLTITDQDVWSSSAPPTHLVASTENLGIAAGEPSLGYVKFDEVRLATTWEEAVPTTAATGSQRVARFQQGTSPDGAYGHVGVELRERSSPSGTDPLIRVGNVEGDSNVGEMRSALGFDLGSIGSGASVNDASLQITVDSVSNIHLLNTLELYALLPGSGGSTMNEDEANWTRRASGDDWTTPGGDLATLLGSIEVGNVGTGDVLTFDATPELLAAVQAALDAETLLELVVVAPDLATEGVSAFIRFRSDDFGDIASTAFDERLSRPQLTVGYEMTAIPEPTAAFALLAGFAGLIRRRR